MNRLFIGLLPSLVLAATGEAWAQAPVATVEASHVVLPGVTFTRSLNGASSGYTIKGGTLVLSSEPKRDFFRYPGFDNVNAPVLLAEVDNGKSFTFSARLTPRNAQTYDAGALYIYVREDLWFKFAMEMDERHKTRLVTVRTVGTSDDNDHEPVSASSAYLKVSSDAKTIGFYYSLDNKTWQLLRMFRNDYPARIWVGVSAQSPMGNGTSVTFEEVSLTKEHVADFRSGV